MSPHAEQPPELGGWAPSEEEPQPTLAPLPTAEPSPLAQTAAELDELEVDAPRVAILVGDKADLPSMEQAESELEVRGISFEVRVLSADEQPAAIAQYAENAQLRGIRVIIAGAGPAARLSSAITAHTELPVIGVPLTSRGARPGRLDALLSELPAPPGEPVAWVGLDDAKNAAVLAARILGA